MDMSKVYVVVVRTESSDQYVYVLDYQPTHLHDDMCYRVWVEEGSMDDEYANLDWYKGTCRVAGYWREVESEGCLVLGSRICLK